MDIYIVKRSYFTFQGKKSYDLEILGKTVAELMQSALSARILEEDSDELPEVRIVLYSCYPFITLEALKDFCSLHEGSFVFEGGYVLRGEGELPRASVVSAGSTFGEAVFSLNQFISATSHARRMQAEKYIAEGVWVEEGAKIDFGVKIGIDSYIGKNVSLTGACILGEGVVIGDNSSLNDCTVGDYTRIAESTLNESTVGARCTVGPYAHLRPFSEVGDDCRIGNYVELKCATVGNGCKIAHLTYVGDATLGDGVNVGCGVVFVNYNGKRKLRSVVEEGAFIGSNCNVIAPVRIGKGAFIAAGTTVVHDVLDGDFCIARSRQQNKHGRAFDYLK